MGGKKTVGNGGGNVEKARAELERRKAQAEEDRKLAAKEAEERRAKIKEADKAAEEARLLDQARQRETRQLSQMEDAMALQEKAAQLLQEQAMARKNAGLAGADDDYHSAMKAYEALQAQKVEIAARKAKVEEMKKRRDEKVAEAKVYKFDIGMTFQEDVVPKTVLEYDHMREEDRPFRDVAWAKASAQAMQEHEAELHSFFARDDSAKVRQMLEQSLSRQSIRDGGGASMEMHKAISKDAITAVTHLPQWKSLERLWEDDKDWDQELEDLDDLASKVCRDRNTIQENVAAHAHNVGTS